jgi:hypothetical protein
MMSNNMAAGVNSLGNTNSQVDQNKANGMPQNFGFSRINNNPASNSTNFASM